MTNRVRRIALGVGLVVALGLVVGAFSADRLTDRADAPATTEAATTEAAPTAPAETDPFPLSTLPTPPDVQTLVFERSYSECSTTEQKLLASKYKAADTSKNGVAAAVGRAWASYFKGGLDAVEDGRDGCLQGFDTP